MKLAPHVLYTRRSDPFLNAAIEREGREARELKLGTFKLAGLQIIGLAGRTFEPLLDFDSTNQRYWDTTPFAVA
jgi:hypothetical protein